MRAEPLVDIAVFARAPIAGATKTRLIPRLGAAGAAQLQRQLIERAVARAQSLPGARVALWTTGPLDSMAEPMMRSGVALRLQHGDDLGARMAHAFAETLDGARPMLLIGTDCPVQTVDDLQNAVAALDGADAVIQPAEDGGYVLIGMKRPHPVMFEHIPWGSDTVLAATRRRAAEAGLRLAEIAPLWDVDRSDDLDRAIALGLVHFPVPS